jgi:hypothetical protein
VLVLNAVNFKAEGPADDTFAAKMIVYRGDDGPWGPLPGATTAESGVLQHSVWQQQPGTKLCMQMLVNSSEVRATMMKLLYVCIVLEQAACCYDYLPAGCIVEVR